MQIKDKVALITSAILLIVGAIVVYFFSLEAGVIFLLLMAFIIVVLQVLQRRQLARVQERTLTLLRMGNSFREEISESKKLQEINAKRFLGILQAQQISMEELSNRVVASRVAEDSGVKNFKS